MQQIGVCPQNRQKDNLRKSRETTSSSGGGSVSAAKAEPSSSKNKEKKKTQIRVASIWDEEDQNGAGQDNL